MEALHAEMRECTACDLRAGCTQVVPGEGGQSLLMFIAEAPSADEDEQGRPLVGRAGQVFRQALRQAGFHEAAVYISNTCRCRPPDNRDPKPDEIEACWPWTLKTLQTVGPKVIVTLGLPATLTMTYKFAIKLPTTQITKVAGKPIYCAERHFYLFPMFHPAYAMRRREAKQAFFAHMQYLRKALPGWLARPRSPK